MAENRSSVRAEALNDIRESINNNLSVEDMKCILCNKSFSTMGNMRRHLRNIHKEDTSNLIANAHMKCPVCTQFSCARSVELYKHLLSVHEIRLEIEHKTFASKTEFDQWKSAMEDETNSSFFKGYGSTRFGDGSIKALYHCSRSGIYKAKGKGKRALKAQGSRKINAACPAKITVITDADNSIKVEFVKTHCGHVLNELKHLTLSKTEKLEIVKKLEMGVDSSVIINDIRKASPKKRKHLLTKKDIYNIKRSFKISDKANNNQSDDDAVTIRLWVDNGGEFPQAYDIQIMGNENCNDDNSTVQQEEVAKNLLLQAAREKFDEVFGICDSLQLAAMLHEMQEECRTKLLAAKGNTNENILQ